MENKRKRICFIVTVSMTVNQFLRWSFEGFKNDGYDVFVIADMDDEYLKTLPDFVKPIPIKMSRGIDPLGMIKAISKMYKVFRKEKFDIVQYSTPNASFYASIASLLARVPIRLYCQWGLVYQGFHGIKRKIFKFIEKFVCKISTDIQPDSHGNLEFCRNNKFYSEKKSRVVWNGSANGLDLVKYDYSKREQYRKEVREQYGLSENDIVMGFLGRVGKEKGFDELMLAFKALSEKYDNLYLLYVGPNERPETVNREMLEFFETSSKVKYTGGWVDDTERYYAAMDFFVFPTYHEGFGSVVIEAEAMGTPVLASDVPGPQNGLKDGVTGFLFPKQQVQPIIDKAELLINDIELRERLGKNAVEFAISNFENTVLLEKILENRNWLIERNKK